MAILATGEMQAERRSLNMALPDKKKYERDTLIPGMETIRLQADQYLLQHSRNELGIYFSFLAICLRSVCKRGILKMLLSCPSPT